MRLWFIALACAAALCAQDDRKHLTVPVESSPKPLSVAAAEIERGAQYPAVIHLKGAVEIRMPVCVATGQGTVQQCSGEIVLHADEVDLHEQTGQIEAKGSVNVTRN